MTGHLIKITAVIAGLAAGTVMAVARGVTDARGVRDARATIEAEERENESEASEVKRDFLRIAKLFALFLVLLGLGGALVATSGIIPARASSGHWAITHLILDFAKVRSVATNSFTLEAPPLDEPWLALKGAGHYETGCRPCHGSPADQMPRIAWRMTPPPPPLQDHVSRWEPEELFYIVKHGIKFTGMPAWPTPLRDDEIWAMVAFLRKLPEMSAEEYKRMAQGDGGKSGEVAPLADLIVPEGARRAVAGNCARCHGVDGLGRGNGAHPRLAGQSRDYLELSLEAYARMERYSGLMEPIAAGLSREEKSEIARYYASLPPAGPQASTEDGAAIARGAAIAQRGIVEQRVPACVSCHGPGSGPRNPVYPVLSGQYADYLELQLKLFKGEQRGGTPYAHIMHRVAIGLNEEQMKDVARYFASLDAAAAGLEAATGSDKQR